MSKRECQLKSFASFCEAKCCFILSLFMHMYLYCSFAEMSCPEWNLNGVADWLTNIGLGELGSQFIGECLTTILSLFIISDVLCFIAG